MRMKWGCKPHGVLILKRVVNDDHDLERYSYDRREERLKL